MKKVKILFSLILILLFGFLIVETLIINDNTTLAKINVLAQLIYTFVTTVLVILTFLVLKATQEQKHQSVRPYLIASEFGVFKNAQKNNREELDFDIFNEGPGLALNINCKVRSKENDNLLYEVNYTRVNVQDNQIYGTLCEIRNEINLIRNKGGNGTYYSPYIPLSIHIEFPLEGNIKDYLSLSVELSYSDIYGKKYKSIFDVRMDEEELEDIECIERFVELE